MRAKRSGRHKPATLKPIRLAGNTRIASACRMGGDRVAEGGAVLSTSPPSLRCGIAPDRNLERNNNLKIAGQKKDSESVIADRPVACAACAGMRAQEEKI